MEISSACLGHPGLFLSLSAHHKHKINKRLIQFFQWKMITIAMPNAA
jgi:hypothetical protein